MADENYNSVQDPQNLTFLNGTPASKMNLIFFIAILGTMYYYKNH